jgi:hypothetical protein
MTRLARYARLAVPATPAPATRAHPHNTVARNHSVRLRPPCRGFLTRRRSFCLAVLMALVGASTTHVIVDAQQQTGVGQNLNIVTGSSDQFVGDMFRQRQNEAVLGTSSINPLHQMAAYNDYRSEYSRSSSIS